MISKELFCEKAGALITDEDRKEYAKCKKRTRVLLGTILPSILVVATLLSIFVSYYCIIVGVFICSFVPIIVKGTSGYKWSNLKNKHSNELFKLLLDDYEYDYRPKAYLKQSIFRASGFGGSYDSYSGEDLMQVRIKNDDGTPSNTIFSICDLDVTEERERTVTDSHGHTHTETYTVTVYNGAFGYVNFPFSFKCSLNLNVFPSFFSSDKSERIKLEDIDFNKRFTTYTDNQIEALCILTPTMMTKLKALDKSAKNLKISLKKNNLYIGFSKNMFELNKKVKTLDGNIFSGFYDDVRNIFEIVEEIKNNNKVFKM